MAAPEREQAVRPADLPGPSGMEWLRLARKAVGSDMAELLSYLQHHHGRTFRVAIPGDQTMVIFSEPEHVEYILQQNQGNYRKASVYEEQLQEVFGQGLLTAEGELWQRQNRIISPMFTRQSVESFGQLILDEVDAMVDRWEAADRASFDLLAEMERVTLLIIGKAMFSTDMEPRAERIGEALATLRRAFRRETNPVWVVPNRLDPGYYRARRAIEYLDETVYSLIRKRRGDGDAYDDLLSRLIQAEDESTGERMDDEQIRDEIITFLLAGHETTASALTWTWYLLAGNPSVHDRLHETVASSALADRTVTFEPALIGDLQYGKQVVQEAMRIYPPVPVIARRPIEPDRVGQYAIPTDVEVVVSQYLTHRDPEVWPEPTAFRPERFAPDEADDRPLYSYYPFGGGARMCTGRQFALLEAQLILGRVIADHRLQVTPTEGVGVNSAVTMCPDRTLTARPEAW